MSVRSYDIQKQKAPRDWSMALMTVGLWLAIIAFGGLFWAINGGFSVIGLGVIASRFNTAGALFWQSVTAITFPVPLVPASVPRQPLIPWIGVIAASLLQVGVLYRRLIKADVPVWAGVAVFFLSGYDYLTTFFGLGAIEWVQSVGVILQLVLAFLLTFIVEATISWLLKQRHDRAQ